MLREQAPMRFSPHRICLGYLALTACLAVQKGLWGLLLLHLALALFIVGMTSLKPNNALRRFYPFVLGPLGYLEVDALRQTSETYDTLVMQWESQLFGTSPAIWMSEVWNSYWLSEFLHFCYLSFYWVAPVLALGLWRSRCLGRFANVTLLTYFGCFLINMIFPVVGPRHLFPPLDPALQGPFWQLTHWILGQGAAGAAAFPSGHAALGAMVALSAWRWHRRVFWVLAPFCLGMCLATIYGRFHYAVDTAAGVGLASFVVFLEGRLAGRGHKVSLGL